MKIFYSIILSFIFISTALSAETNQFNFAESKKIHKIAGAWKYQDSTMKFFFEDGTVLHVNFGETSVGHWKFINKGKTQIEYSAISSDKTEYKWKAIIEGDKLHIDHDDYYSTCTRIKFRETY